MTTIDRPSQQAIDPAALDALIGRFVGDLGATLAAATMVVGDKLGLYKALAELGPCTSTGLASATALDARLVDSWVKTQYSSGYAEHDEVTGTFWLSPEQAALLADDSTPAFLIGGMSVATSVHKDEERISEAFRTGAGLAWADHHHDLFHGTERFFRPGYLGNLVDAWLPALDGVVASLQAGASVADVGCGYGASTILMAQAYPASTFVGFDSHDGSIKAARERAQEAGVADRVTFEVASAQDFPGSGYDLVCVFDALHDMGDPVGGAAHVLASLAPTGTWLLVEPMAADTLGRDPVSRIFHAAGTGICVGAAEAQDGGYALGNQVPDERWRQLMAEAGFTRFRRATETPFNRVFEVRP